MFNRVSPLQCLLCRMSKIVFRKEQSLMYHIWRKHSRELLSSKYELDTKNLNIQELVIKYNNFDKQKFTKYKHVCSICDEIFSRKPLLIQHLRVHRPKVKMSMKCDDCGMEFFSHTRHYKSCGKITESKHVCELCGQVLTTRSSLLRHVRGHASMPSYLCDTCGKKFIHKSKLKRHKKLHTGEKPYVCSYCKRGFALKDTLLDHIRTHTKERPFKCDVCNKGFTQRAALRTHKLGQHISNKPYECKKCFDVFSTRKLLQEHNSCEMVVK